MLILGLVILLYCVIVKVFMLQLFHNGLHCIINFITMNNLKALLNTSNTFSVFQKPLQNDYLFARDHSRSYYDLLLFIINYFNNWCFSKNIYYTFTTSFTLLFDLGRGCDQLLILYIQAFPLHVDGSIAIMRGVVQRVHTIRNTVW